MKSIRCISYQLCLLFVASLLSYTNVQAATTFCDTTVYTKYPFINRDADVIDLNGSDWSGFIDAMGDTDNRLVNIVHIGDSHIQADIATTRVRHQLQNVFGAAGRGLLVPHRLSGSNEATDYKIESHTDFVTSRLVGRGSKDNVGFTGVGLTYSDDRFDMSISADEPFEHMRVFYSGSPLTLVAAEYDGAPIVVTSLLESDGCLTIDLPFACESINLDFSALGPVTIFGAEIMSDIVGVAYHTIGVNGAAYGSYLQIGDFGKYISSLNPDLIVVSLGTNDSVGRFDAEDFSQKLSDLCQELTQSNPQAKLLLLTPSEFQQRRRRGKRRRSSFTVSPNVSQVAEIIRMFGHDNGVAIYDWYTVAGASGSSTRWLKAGLLSSDRIHNTRTGYELAGQLLSNALLRIVEKQPARETENTNPTID